MRRSPDSDAGVRWRIARTLRHGTPAVLSFVVLLVGWQAYVGVSGLPPVVLPSPIAVLEAGLAARAILAWDGVVTAATAGLGLVAGGAVGFLVAVASVGSRTVEATVYPYLIALRIAPVVAIAPLLFLWFGDGLLPRAALVATMTSFPVAVASLDGLRSTPETYLDLLRTVDAPPSRVVRSIRLPAAVPSVLAGVKLAAVLSVVGAVVAEFLALERGLGYRVFAASEDLRTPLMFAALFVLSALGVGFYLLVAAIERTVPWEPPAGDG